LADSTAFSIQFSATVSLRRFFELRRKAHGLPLVKLEAIERHGQNYGGINPPEVGDFEEAIGEFF